MDKQKLKYLINQGYSTYNIAKETNIGQTTVRYWLNKFGLNTLRTDGKYRCKFCGETDKEKFANKGKGVLSRSKCKKCHNQKTIERIRGYKLRAVEYKGGKCNKCGYNKCVGSLHFHHRNPKEKDINWKQIKNWSFEKIKLELDKCDLVCANCHGEIHWGFNIMGVC